MNYKDKMIDFNTNQRLELKCYFPQKSPVRFSLSRNHMRNFLMTPGLLLIYAQKTLKEHHVQNTLSLDRQMSTTDVQIIWFLKMFSLDDSFGHQD